MSKRLTKVYAQEHIDNKTGIVDNIVLTKEFVAESEPPFVKLYLSDIFKLFGVTPNTHSILYALLKYMQYETNELVIDKAQREYVAKDVKCHELTVKKAVSDMVKRNILLPTGKRSRYIVNPILFGKGKWSDIKRLRMLLIYQENSRKMEISIEREEESCE